MYKIKSLKPLYTGILTTANKYGQDNSSGLILDTNKLEGNIKEYQTVVAIGSSVREVKVGDTVLINFKNYLVKDKARPENEDGSIRTEFVQQTYHLELPVMEVDDKEVLNLQERDIAFVAEIEEIKEDSNAIIKPKAPKIKTPKIVL